MLSHEEHVALALPDQLATQETGFSGYHDTIISALTCRRVILDTALAQFLTRAEAVTEVATLLVETLRSGHKVLVAGNGGSAAEAQHFASELVGRFKRERAPYAVLSLTTDTSIITAVSNDYGYHDVFARQVIAFGQPGDLLIAYSTSGESENLVRAAAAGHQCLMKVVAITGDRHSQLERVADLTIRVPVVDTAVAQELHMLVTHILCDIAESELASCDCAMGEGDWKHSTLSTQGRTLEPRSGEMYDHSCESGTPLQASSCACDRRCDARYLF